MNDTPRLFLIELNEVNFDYVRKYVSAGKLPCFGRCLKNSSVVETTSEDSYEKLEPWIQWVTAHTGLSLEEHGVFRLGDITDQDIPQLWEQLEDEGFSVGAISPMNAKNRTRQSAFFVPDPWTRTKVSGPFLIRKLYDAVAQAVNDNAASRITLKSAFWLMLGAARFARISNYANYLNLVLQSRRKPWFKAMFLDLLLADLFIKLNKATSPAFCSLFLNAGAHIQHHYLFSSGVYEGTGRNPEWYIAEGVDPVLDVYEMYDSILANIIAAFPDTRLMIATGLHQDPHPSVTYYWRLTNHAGFLRKHNIPFQSVEPKMSRDFHIKCANEEQANVVEAELAAMKDRDGVALFEIDNRGRDLFVMLTYPGNIDNEFEYLTAAGAHGDFRGDVSFVAIKNGQHNGVGYFVDLGESSESEKPSMSLTELPQRVRAVMHG